MQVLGAKLNIGLYMYITIEACVAGYGRHYRFLVLYTNRVNLFLTKRFDHTTVVFFSGNAQYST